MKVNMHSLNKHLYKTVIHVNFYLNVQSMILILRLYRKKIIDKNGLL